MTAPGVRIIPSPLRGLATGTGSIVDALLARAQLQLRGRQIAIEERRARIEERRADLEEHAAAFDRLIKMAPFIRPGSQLRENTFLHEDFEVVFPGSNPQMSDLVLNRETIQDILLPEFKSVLETLPEETRRGVLERGLNRIILGEGLSADELSVRGQVTKLQADGLQALLQDRRFVEDTARRAAGLEQSIVLRVPDAEGNLQDVTFNTADAARISAELWKHWDLLAWTRQRFRLEEAAKLDVVGEFMETLAARDILVTRANANAIVNAVHSEEPQAAVATLRAQPQWNQTLDAALQLYMGGFNLATQSPIPEVARFPGLQLYLALGRELEARIGKDATADLLPGIASVLSEEGVQIGQPLGFFSRMLGKPFDIFGPLPEPERGDKPPAKAPEGLSPLLIEAVRDALRAGEVNEDFVRENYGQDVLDAALGRGRSRVVESTDDSDATRKRLSEMDARLTNLRQEQQQVEREFDATSGSARVRAMLRLREIGEEIRRLQAQTDSLSKRVGSGGRF